MTPACMSHTYTSALARTTLLANVYSVLATLFVHSNPAHVSNRTIYIKRWYKA